MNRPDQSRAGETAIHDPIRPSRACDVLNTAMERLESAYEERERGHVFGFGIPSIDAIVGNMVPGGLIVVAGPSCVGKTSLTVELIAHVAIRLRRPTLMVTLEGTAVDLVQRLLARQSLVDLQRLRRGELEEKEWPRLTKALSPITEAPLYILDTVPDDLADLDLPDVSPELICVDYLQVVHQVAPRHADVPAALKRLAKKAEAAVVVVSHDDASSAVVNTRSFPEGVSGSVEHAADVVIRMEEWLAAPPSRLVDIDVTKNRYGLRGSTQVAFEPQYCHFIDVTAAAPDEVDVSSRTSTRDGEVVT